MSNLDTKASQLDFYHTQAQPCNYLPNRQAINLLADPTVPITARMYGQLIDYGFRRSGNYIYRPHCHGCNACVPVRLPVAEFRPNRSQKRTWRRNQDLDARCVAPAYNEEHFRLYQRYLGGRHSGSAMDGREQYLDFLTSPYINTALYEFRLQGRLLAVAVVDQLPQGLSAVYTFFDPAQSARGLGNYAVLWEIHEAERKKLDWLYLGYWIKECRKMNYKDQYRPIEVYRNKQWKRLP